VAAVILRRSLVTAAAGCALLGGCAAPAPASEDAGPPAATQAAPDGAVPLPWPAHSAAEAAGLQRRVDDGAQPWLLDPAEVALSYVAAAYGWDAARTALVPDDAVEDETVQVTGPDGALRTLTLRQPDRTGSGGIWVVTADATS